MAQETKDERRTRHLDAIAYVRNDIANEIAVQAMKWGYQEHSFGQWEIIFKEELAEAKTQVFVAGWNGYEELIHAAAVLISWLRDIKKHEIYKEGLSGIYKEETMCSIELRTMKAMVKEWRKRVKQEIVEASNDRDAEAQEGNELEFECTKYYIKGLKHALREGDII